ncbi:MAG TPA: hypothetical protein VEE84_06510 [Burkholderiaceae bacterium]|nr:hypothetical protein [Burkholderiaceae bacterium]
MLIDKEDMAARGGTRGDVRVFESIAIARGVGLCCRGTHTYHYTAIVAAQRDRFTGYGARDFVRAADPGCANQGARIWPPLTMGE